MSPVKAFEFSEAIVEGDQREALCFRDRSQISVHPNLGRRVVESGEVTPTSFGANRLTDEVDAIVSQQLIV